MRIWEIREKLPKVKLWLQVDDGTESLLHGALDYERTLRAAHRHRAFRGLVTTFICCTPAAHGMPKG
jgi:hypothetical protein